MYVNAMFKHVCFLFANKTYQNEPHSNVVITLAGCYKYDY